MITEQNGITETTSAEQKKVQKKATGHSIKMIARPIVFDYTNYRDFLRDGYEFLKLKNPAFSENAFVQAAGLGKNSRGYLGLILKEKRNLANKTIIGFSKVLKLSSQESIYFENLVYFNQATTDEDKKFYFERMQASIQGIRSKKFEILEGQYRFVNNWHYLAIRELVNLSDFEESESYIYKKLKKRVDKKSIMQAIDDLINLGFITRNQKGKLVQSDSIVTFNDTKENFKNTTKLHTKYLEVMKEMMEQEGYENRSAQLLTISCSQEDFESLREEIRDFRDHILEKYARSDKSSDLIIQCGLQLGKLTN